MPVGCSAFDDWLLDALDVDKLLSAIKTDKKIDLTSICSSENAKPHVKRQSLASDVSEAFGAQLDLERGDSLPKLGISFLSSQMDDQGLRDVAFEIFTDCCGTVASSELLQSMTGQLEISKKRAESLQSLLGKVRSKNVANMTEIESHIKMLEIASPSDFQNFQSYMTWRDGTSMLIQLSLIHSVQMSWKSDSTDVSAHYLLAVMKGGFRRLDSREADDYDEKEKAEAVKAVASVCKDIASRCDNGYQIPWDLKASIAEALLRGCFDSFDNGSLIDEVDELEQLLVKNVWPSLGISKEIHRALQIWAHYRQFYISKELSLLDRAIDIASRVDTPTKTNKDVNQKDKLVHEIVNAISTECVRVLSDYHQLCKSPREVSAMIRLLVSINKISGKSANLEETIANVVKSSVTTSFERKAEELRQHAPSVQDQVSLLATTCLELMRVECEEYAPMFHHYISNSSAIAAAALHEAYGAKILPWIVMIRSLDKTIIGTLSTAMSLEDQLLLEMMQVGMEPPEWGVLDRVTPQLYDWTGGQLKTLKEWGERILSSENWKISSHSSHGCGNSVGEILKASTDVLESLFTMGIPIPPGVVRCLVDGVDGVLQEYCDGIILPLRSVNDIFPPKPPLTRYKKDLVDTAEQVDSPSKPGVPEKSPSSLKNITAKVGSVFTSSWLPNLNTKQKEVILEVSYESLAMQANSLSKVADGMGKMVDVVTQKWEAGQPRSSRAKSKGESLGWTSGMFGGVVEKATNNIEVVLHFTALKLICGHLRDEIFNQLYRFSVRDHRIHPILPKIDECLGRMCSILYPSMTSDLVQHFCKTLSDAVTHVLLDGGPVRWFSLSDGTLLKEDIEAMGYMFYADGDGLDQETIESLMKTCVDAVQLMEEDTGSLISQLKKEPSSRQADTILRILCHRKDHSASKYLKKEYKIQKKLPNIVQSSMSKKG